MALVNLTDQVRVAVFMTRFEPGGTERQMIELIRRLGPPFQVHVACFERAGAWLPRVRECAASVVEFPISGFARPGTAFQLLSFAHWCRRERIAVVQTCDLYANIFGLPGAAIAGVPVRIGSRRELNPDKSRRQLLLQRQAYRCATKVVANSPAARAALCREGLAPESIAVIANGVDARAFAVYEHSERPRTLIAVANLRPEKSHETLLRALAALVPDHGDLRLLIVGDGPRRGELQAMARALGIDRQTEFLGHREDVPALLAGADIFVLPSRSEAFPNSAIEAMAAGLPVIACAVGGLRDLIQPGRTGVLVPPDDAGALARALRDLIEHPLRAAALGSQARQCVLERYSFERMVDAFETLYLSGLPVPAAAATAEAEV